MIKLGLTGSIATGKSTTAQMFADEGLPVHDSDAAVHAIYEGEGVAPVGALIPSAIEGGRVSRPHLREALKRDPDLLGKLESIVHPLTAKRREEAAKRAQAEGHAIMVFDIPLLFETGLETQMDAVVATFCDPEVQMKRLMARPGMTEQTANLLIDRQMPQNEKRKLAHFEIDTGQGLVAARREVRAILEDLRA